MSQIKQRIRKFLIRDRARFHRGQSYYNEVISFFKLIVFVILARDTTWVKGLVAELNIPITMLDYIIIFGFAFYIVSSWYLGNFDQKKGIWLEEAKWHTKEVNPYFKDMENDIAYLKKKVNIINRKIDEWCYASKKS